MAVVPYEYLLLNISHAFATIISCYMVISITSIRFRVRSMNRCTVRLKKRVNRHSSYSPTVRMPQLAAIVYPCIVTGAWATEDTYIRYIRADRHLDEVTKEHFIRRHLLNIRIRLLNLAGRKVAIKIAG
jgi:hypothetical protein